MRAPWDYRRITVRLPLTIARCPSDFPLIMTFKIVREPSGYPPVTLRCPYGPSTAYYGLSTACLQSYGLMKTPGKFGSSLLSTPAPARLVKTVPGPLRIVGHPTGTLRVPHGNGQNYCFYSPYGALNGYVTAALATLTLTKRK